MIGDKVKALIGQLRNLPYAINMIEGMQELDQLIEAKNERDSLKARVEELELENKQYNKHFSEFEIYDICELTLLKIENEELQRTAEIGEAAILSTSKGLKVSGTGTSTNNKLFVESESYFGTVKIPILDWYRNEVNK